MTDSAPNTDELDPSEGQDPAIENEADSDASEELSDPLEEALDADSGAEVVAEAAEEPLDPEEQASIEAEIEEALRGDDFDDSPEDADVDDDDGEGEGETEFDALQAEYATLSDRQLRLAAEFNNYRRRTEQERLESWTRAQADLAEKFLDVLDDLHRVADLDLSNATVEAIMEGIDLVEKKFMRVLADSGMEQIDPVGEAFDPESMEAMMRVPTDSEEEDDVVAQVFQKGYTLKGVLVRPARVSVHKAG